MNKETTELGGYAKMCFALHVIPEGLEILRDDYDFVFFSGKKTILLIKRKSRLCDLTALREPEVCGSRGVNLNQ